jgi:hypothetical protein
MDSTAYAPWALSYAHKIDIHLITLFHGQTLADRLKPGANVVKHTLVIY